MFIKDKQIYGVDEVELEDMYFDLSSNSKLSRELSIFNVKDSDGVSIYELWKPFQKVKIEEQLLGFYEYMYIMCLNKEQLQIALSINAITDSKYNNIRVMRAIMAVNLLYKQRKINYLLAPEKFLYWYWANCSYIVRYVEDEFND